MFEELEQFGKVLEVVKPGGAKFGRRQFLRNFSSGTFLLASSLLFGGCTSSKAPENNVQDRKPAEKSQVYPKYDGPIDKLKGFEYVPEPDFIKMVEALKNTGHPVLDKIARGIMVLHNAKSRPREFPDWIDERSFPLIVLQDQTHDSITAFEITKYSGEETRFLIPNMGANISQEGVEKIFKAIKLGLKGTPVSGDPLIPAILLAKEYLTLLHGIAMNEEFYDVVKKLNPHARIIDTKGLEITDKSKQKAVGRQLLTNNVVNEASVFWKVLDGFTILMLGPVVRDLIATGRIKKYGNLGAFVLAANLITNSPTEVQRNFIGLIDSWRTRQGYIFPAGFGEISLTDPYLSMVISLEDQIDKLLQPTPIPSGR